MTSIEIAEIRDDGTLALDVNQHLIERGLAILGMRGSGKSYSVGVIIEQLAELGCRFIVIDLMGEYNTIRQKYPVPLAALGDAPYAKIKNLRPENAAQLVRQVVEANASLILDLKRGTMKQKFEFLAKFLEALYQVEEELHKPYVLIVDEAHRICPEKGTIRLKEVREAQERVHYWMYELGAVGRHFGCGLIVIARRTAEISKAILGNCELKLFFKLVDPTDMDRLRAEGVSKEMLPQIKRLEQGEAVVVGLEEPIFIRVHERITSHGGETPLAEIAETPDLMQLESQLEEVLCEAVEEGPPEPVKKVVEPYRQQIVALKDQISAGKEKYETEIETLQGNKARLEAEVEHLNGRLGEFEQATVLPEEVAGLKNEVERYRERITELEGELDQASQLEEKLASIRDVMADQKELWIETADLLDIELIPPDVKIIQDELATTKSELNKLWKERDAEEKAVELTMADPGVKSWIKQMLNTLSNFATQTPTANLILKTMVASYPESALYPEEIQTGMTEGTNRKYLKNLVTLNLVTETEKGARAAYSNRLPQCVVENVRRIRPSTPDDAINQITDSLRAHVLEER